MISPRLLILIISCNILSVSPASHRKNTPNSHPMCLLEILPLFYNGDKNRCRKIIEWWGFQITKKPEKDLSFTGSTTCNDTRIHDKISTNSKIVHQRICDRQRFWEIWMMIHSIHRPWITLLKQARWPSPQSAEDAPWDLAHSGNTRLLKPTQSTKTSSGRSPDPGTALRNHFEGLAQSESADFIYELWEETLMTCAITVLLRNDQPYHPQETSPCLARF